MESCVVKVAELRKRFPQKDIQVDGGVGPGTIGCCARAGTSRHPHLRSSLTEIDRLERDRSGNSHLRSDGSSSRHFFHAQHRL